MTSQHRNQRYNVHPSRFGQAFTTTSIVDKKDKKIRPTIERNWFIKYGSTSTGPFSYDEMRLKYNNGLLNEDVKVNNNLSECSNVWRSVHDYYPDSVYFPPFEDLPSAIVPVRKDYPWQYFKNKTMCSKRGLWKCQRRFNDQTISGKEIYSVNEEDLLIEATALRNIPHKNIVQFYESFLYERQLVILSQYIGETTIHCLCSLINKWPKEAMAYVVGEVLNGLQAIHCLNRSHGHLGSKDILCNSKGQVKISNIGTAYEDQSTQQAQTIIEVKADIRSLGIVTFEMAEGHIDISDKGDGELVDIILASMLTDEPPSHRNHEWSTEYRTFIQGALEKNKDSLFSTEQALGHSFVQLASMASFIEFIKFIE